MTVIRREVHVHASPEEAMAILSDARHWPDWYPGMSAVTITAPFPEPGGKVTFKVKSAGLSLPITETVLDFQPSRLHVFQMEGALSGNARWELTPSEAGTHLATTFDYDLPGGPVGKLVDLLIVSRLNAKSLDEGLSNFKALVERAPATP